MLYKGGLSFEDLSDDGRLYVESGYWLAYLFRQRPEPEYFKELTISIAHAVACMPKLSYMNMKFETFQRDNGTNGTSEHLKRYECWAFYFRSTINRRF